MDGVPGCLLPPPWGPLSGRETQVKYEVGDAFDSEYVGGPWLITATTADEYIFTHMPTGAKSSAPIREIDEAPWLHPAEISPW